MVKNYGIHGLNNKFEGCEFKGIADSWLGIFMILAIAIETWMGMVFGDLKHVLNKTKPLSLQAFYKGLI
jgi:hypothetical protein